MTAQWNRFVRALLNDADIATPDGMPIVWALRSFGVRHQKRVYGPQLMLTLCEQAMRCGHGIFLYGGREETLPDLRHRLERQFPGLIMAGTYSPPFRPLTAEEDAAVIERIVKSDADIVFVGISTPKQERWMWEHRDKLPGVVMLGVGAAFDFHAGRVKQAPPWMQQSGLEWFFRLLMEPARLWKRYLLVNPLFLPLWALQRLGILKYSHQAHSQL
jgi:N-acetylglucosaminyldiphosphoundecaprenol N-acetyl-beta-D-mannosaminyltransferase